MKIVTLKPKRSFPTECRHPWIFSGAVDSVSREPEPGETVQVVSDDGRILGLGAWSPASQIRVRMWIYGPGGSVDAAFIRDRVQRAIGQRAMFLADGVTNAFRLINAEADGLPGVTVDFYNGWCVAQFTAAGAERWKETVADAVMACFPCNGLYERSDADVREREALEAVNRLMRGEEPPAAILIEENGCKFEVDVRGGHKTGFYLDQRDNRILFAPYANGCEVLNAFSYTGGFGIAALAAGAAKITHVDLSAPALEQARANTLLNACKAEQSEFIQGSVFDVLRRFRDQRRSFDAVVLDPPKFADSKGALMKAARGYKDINLLGIKLLRPGGLLATFSCSGAMDSELFHTIVAEAARDAGRDVQVIRRLQQAADHPESLAFPEGFYLKGLLCRVW